MEGVERVALLVTPWTRERRPELGLEYGLHERIIAPPVVGQRFRRNHLIRSTVVVLQGKEEKRD